MTISTEDPNVYSASVVEGVAILYDKPVHAKEELKVYVSDGSLATLNVDYTITLDTVDYDSADVIPLAGLVTKADGLGVWIKRVLPFTQTLPIATNNRLNEDELEKVGDRAAMRDQQLQAQFGRALMLPEPETSGGAIPSKAARKGKMIGFDSTTGDMVFGGNIDVALDVAAAVAAAATATTAAAAAVAAADVVTGQMATHLADADPHPQYQKESEKGAANGYASLDGTGKVPLAQLPDIGGDYIVLNVAGSSTAAGATDYTTEWDAAVALANSTGKELRIRPDVVADRRWIKLQPGRQFPYRAKTVAPCPVGIMSTTTTGVLFDQKLAPNIDGDILIDGGLTLETVADGYVSGHMGMKISATVADTVIPGVVIRNVKFQNFGEYGLETYYLDDPIFDNVSAERIGVCGTVHWSVKNGRQVGGILKNIFPGLPAGDWQRNAYGATASQFTGKRQSSMKFIEVKVQDVPTWTGLDTHTSEGVDFIGCEVSGCSQGIAFENHIPGVTMRSAKVQRNRIIGFGTGGSVTKDGLTCYSAGGIIVNSTGAPQALGVLIQGNELDGCGERRPGVTGGSGAISVRHARSVNISDNVARICQQVGINLVGATSSTDEILMSMVRDNIIDGVTSHESITKGILAGAYVQGDASGNEVNGAGSSADSYDRSGTPVYGFTYNTVSAFGTTGDNFWN